MKSGMYSNGKCFRAVDVLGKANAGQEKQRILAFVCVQESRKRKKEYEKRRFGR